MHPLGCRALLRVRLSLKAVIPGVLVLAILAPSSHAAYTSTHAGTTATMTGNSVGVVGDILYFSHSGAAPSTGTITSEDAAVPVPTLSE